MYRFKPFISLAALILLMSCSMANAATINQESECEKQIAVVQNSAYEIIPLKNLDGIEVLGNSFDAANFSHFCKLYAPVSFSKDINDEANTLVVVVTDNSNNTRNTMTQALKSGKPVIAVFIGSEDLKNSYNELFVNNAPAAIIQSKTDDGIAAQAIFGGIDIKSGSKYIKANRLGYDSPEAVGVDSKIILTIDSLANKGVETGAFPGCQILMARNGKIFFNKNYGYTDPDKKHLVDDFTIYDLASVSKATGTLPGIMLAYDKGMIALDAKISTYIPQLRGTDKEDITVKELLFHESGMQPSINLYDVMIDHDSYSGELFANKKDKTHTVHIQKGLYGNKKAKLRNDIVNKNRNGKYQLQIADNIWGSQETYDTIMHRIYNNKLRKDKSYAYSCLNFCLLMNIEQNASGIPHNLFVNDNIYAPIGAYHTGYRPFERFDKDNIAPTEFDALLRKQKLHGFTHDELACFSGGIQGNAGLFSNATDIAKLCQMWLNMGEYGGSRILSHSTVKRFTTEKSATCRRGLGFDKPDTENPEDSPTCEEADPSVYGHLGYTGTIFWVDPKNDMIFIFLCNRVNPTRSNQAFTDLDIRPKLFKAFYDNIQK
ncbi:MAG: serine hydrolase [Muribaculaceae bacterium]|nr:serine hydrolase [Muribaculaceae bacterium]